MNSSGRYRHYLMGILFCLFLMPLTATPYIFDHITQKDGLPNNAVSGIVQDRRGYLWFGTQNGLCRYDGRSFKTYNHDPFDSVSLPHNLIQTLYLDPVDPYLWIGTYEGLSRFHLETETFYNYRTQGGNKGETLSNEVVTSVVKDRDGAIWVGTFDGLNKIDPDTGNIQYFFHNDMDAGTLLHNRIRKLFIDNRDRLWIGSDGGLDLYDPESERFGHFRAEIGSPDSFQSPVVMSIAQTDDYSLWIGTWDGTVSLLEPHSGQIMDQFQVDGNIYLLSSDPTGNLWIGTWGNGLYKLSVNSDELSWYESDPEDPYKLNHGIIYSFYMDRGGVYWIGTNGMGLNKLNPQKKDFRFIYQDGPDGESLINDRIRDILIDKDKRYWVATYSQGLWRFDGEPGDWDVHHWMPDPENPWSLSHHNVADIMEDSQGRIWLGTLDGINRYIPETNDFDRIEINGLKQLMGDSPVVYALTEDLDGSIWIGTHSRGVIHWSESDGVLGQYFYQTGSPSLSNNLVFCQFLDSKGNLWVGTNQGLNRYDRKEDRFEIFYHDLKNRLTLSHNVITDIFEDSQERIWIGTAGGGLNLFKSGSKSFFHYTHRDGLASNSIQSIQEDHQNRLWISTIRGISILNLDDNSILNIDESDGIIVDQMDSSSTIDDKGLIYFGSSLGVLRFDSAILYDNQHPPPLWINEFLVMGEAYPFLDAINKGEEISLNWDQSFLSFEFAALDFTSPDQNLYRYKLDGLDRDWINSGTRNYVAYQNLSPGRYVFHLQAANNDGVWNREGISIPIYIKGPPWKQRWFIGIYILAVAMLIILISNLQANALLKKKLSVAEDSRNNLQVLNDKLEQLAWKDGLTGLANRRFFDLSLSNLWHLAVREKKFLTLLMIDVDHFKAYNDFYGHQMGDEALKQAASVIKSIMRRDTDAVCRYGGEEFTVLLFDTDIEEGKSLCESLLNKMEDRQIPHEGSPVAPYLTLSVGLCGFIPDFEQLPDELIEEADKALYEAKNQGRNRYVLYKGRYKEGE